MTTAVLTATLQALKKQNVEAWQQHADAFKKISDAHTPAKQKAMQKQRDQLQTQLNNLDQKLSGGDSANELKVLMQIASANDAILNLNAAVGYDAADDVIAAALAQLTTAIKAAETPAHNMGGQHETPPTVDSHAKDSKDAKPDQIG